MTNFSNKNFYLSKDYPKLSYYKGAQAMNVHWGQLKLLGTEILFLISVYDENIHNNPVVVYSGAAAGHHIEIMKKLFSKIKWILYDPCKFFYKKR